MLCHPTTRSVGLCLPAVLVQAGRGLHGLITVIIPAPPPFIYKRSVGNRSTDKKRLKTSLLLTFLWCSHIAAKLQYQVCSGGFSAQSLLRPGERGIFHLVVNKHLQDMKSITVAELPCKSST